MGVWDRGIGLSRRTPYAIIWIVTQDFTWRRGARARWKSSLGRSTQNGSPSWGSLRRGESVCMDWPTHFPDNCPPEDAKPAAGTAYRLTHNPFEPRDFWTKREMHPEKRFSDPITECQANGLSIFRNIEDAKRLRRTVPYFRNETNAIAVGSLSPELGVTKPTRPDHPSSHCSWWVPVGVDRALLLGLSKSRRRKCYLSQQCLVN